MAMPGLTDDQIRAIIAELIATDGNYTHTAQNTGRGYNAVLKYAHRWRTGQLSHITGLPSPTDPSPAVVRAKTDATDGESATATDLRRQSSSLRRERDLLLQERDRLRQAEDFAKMVRETKSEIPR